jgi:hypothetical protein
MVFLGAIFVLVGVALPWYAWREGWMTKHSDVVGFACLLFPLALGVLALGSAYGNWRKAAVVYQGGFAYSDNNGPRSLRWDEFTAMTSDVTKHYRNGLYVGTTHRHKLMAQGHDWVILTKNDFPEMAELAELLGRGIFPHLHKVSCDEWDAERWVTFGPVAVHKSDGVRVQGTLHPWASLASLSVEKGRLCLVQREASLWTTITGKSRVAISEIPNFPVLMAVVDQAVHVRTD